MAIFSAPRSKLVTSPILEEVRESLKLLNGLNLVDQSLSGRGETQRVFDKQSNEICQWLKNSIDLADFQYRYPINGITHGIEVWAAEEKRLVNYLEGDYLWPSIVAEKVQSHIHWKDVSEGVLYLSNPSSIEGNYLDDWEELVESGVPIVLDCAYLGTSIPKRIKLTKFVEIVMFSFSKPFGLHSLRAGWLFSRNRINRLELLREVGYQSLVNLRITEMMTNHFDLNFMYKKLSNKQEVLCNFYDLEKSDSVLFANSQLSQFDEFKRKKGACARIPLVDKYRLECEL